MLTLNLGCGERQLAGAVNIDLRRDVDADLIADVRRLPYADGEADQIIAYDLLEHFPADQTQTVLDEWARVLKSGGELALKVPNLLRLAIAIAQGSGNIGAAIRNIYGGHRWGPDGAWDTHHTGWTPDLLTDELDRAGFTVISNDLALNMTVIAVRR